MLKVTCALIIKNNCLLLTQNSLVSDHPLLWEFPGGKVKENEELDESIIREIKEELDVEVQILKALKPVVFDYGAKKIELIPFLCSIINGEVKLKVHNDLEWVSLKKLHSVDFSGADRALVQIEENWNILKEYIGE